MNLYLCRYKLQNDTWMGRGFIFQSENMERAMSIANEGTAFEKLGTIVIAVEVVKLEPSTKFDHAMIGPIAIYDIPRLSESR